MAVHFYTFPELRPVTNSDSKEVPVTPTKTG